MFLKNCYQLGSLPKNIFSFLQGNIKIDLKRNQLEEGDFIESMCKEDTKGP